MVFKATVVFALLLMLAGCGVQSAAIQQLSNDEKSIADALDIVDCNEQQELLIEMKNLSEDGQSITDALVIADYNEQQVTTIHLSEDEQGIADTIVTLTHNMLNMEGPTEYYILTLLEDAVIRVSYVEGYIWRYSGHYDEELVAVAPEGITCFLRPPEDSWEGFTYWVFLIGKKDDNSYYDHVFGWYPDSCTIEEHIGSSFWNQPLEDIIRTFELYIPPR